MDYLLNKIEINFKLRNVAQNLPTMRETWVQSLYWEDSLEKGMATHPSILTWESYGQRSMVGYSPWGHKESDMSEQLTHTHTHRGTHIHPTLTSYRETIKLKGT